MTERAHENVVGLLRGEQRAPSLAHGDAVAEHAERTALAIGFTPPRAARIRLAGTLHDIGKTMISECVLSKPGPLNAREWAQIKLHPVLGEQMLLGEGLFDIAPWVRAHHERYNGLGYPDGLVGTEIPIEARILAVADAYDAMLSARAYKDAIDPAAAAAELRREVGAQFDPLVVAAFLLSLEHKAWMDDRADTYEASLALV